jgi:hypothetical protein
MRLLMPSQPGMADSLAQYLSPRILDSNFTPSRRKEQARAGVDIGGMQISSAENGSVGSRKRHEDLAANRSIGATIFCHTIQSLPGSLSQSN